MGQLIDNLKPKSPCKECVPPIRFVGCHSVCPDYKEYRSACDLASMQIRERKLKETAYEAYKKDRHKVFVK